MKNGTIILWKTPKKLKDIHGKWYEKIVKKMICIITRGDYDHVAIIVNDFIYQSGHPYGMTKSKFKLKRGPRYVYKELITDISQTRADLLQVFLEDLLNKNIRYNYPKLFSFLLIFPTRKIWDKLRWVPFSSNYWFGIMCSVTIAEALRWLALVIQPGRYHETISPQCCSTSPLYGEDKVYL